MMVLYLAGPYTASHGRSVDSNIQTARLAAIDVWNKGHAAICPHMNTAYMDNWGCNIGWQGFIDGDFEIIKRCDGLIMLPHWEQSKGACAEHKLARQLGLPIWVYPHIPDA